MADWNPRSASAWASLLGMVRVPMFAPARSQLHSGKHAVILDGTLASFSLSIGDVDSLVKQAEGPISWSWSANVRHSVMIDEARDVCLMRRWDAPTQIREQKLPSVDDARLLPTRFHDLELPESPTVIDRSLSAFRYVRNGAEQSGGNDIDAIKVFNSLLVWADVLRATGQPSGVSDAADLASVVSYLAGQRLLKYHPDDFSPSIRAYPLAEAAALLLRGQENDTYLLDAGLLIRHASGTVFQEAHIEIDRSTRRHQPSLFGALWASDEPRRGKPKRDAHFTPPSLARLLVQESLDELRRTKGELPQKISVLDPACGSGVFFTEMIRFLAETPGLALDLHGFDNAPISRIMSEFSVERTKAEFARTNAAFEVFQGDSLQVSKWGEPDIILMNPPFTAWTALTAKERNAVKSVLGDWYSGHSDTAVAFVARAVRSLRPGSVLATVVPAALLESRAAAKFRETVLGSHDISIRMIGRFRGYGYFHDAIVEPAFIVLSRSPRRPEDRIRFVLAETGNEEQAIRAVRYSDWQADLAYDGFEVFNQTYDFISARSWLPRPPRGANLVHRLFSANRVVRVDALFDTNLGVRPGLKRAFLVPAGKLQQLAPTALERAFFRPIADKIINGRIITDTYIFYPYSENGKLAIKSEAELSRVVPTFYRNRLLAERETLAARKSQRHRKWWELVEPRPTWQGAVKPKIVTQAFAQQGGFAFDEAGNFVVVQGVAWIPRTMYGIDRSDFLWGYIAILNSEPFERLLDFFCSRVGGGQYEVYPKYVDQLPIPDLSGASESIISRLARAGKELAAGREISQPELSTLVCLAYGVSCDDFQRAMPLNEQERLSLRFEELVERWRRETGMLSSVTKIIKHEAYQSIIGMGERAIPLILRELRDRPNMWFPALRAIANDSPVPVENRADPRLAREAWLAWGRKRGLIE